jgi:electron transfer flavoprotein alpha subunit
MNILSVAIHKDNKLSGATLEVLGVAKSLGGECLTVVLAEAAQPLAEELAAKGGGKVLAVSDPVFSQFNDEAYAKAVTQLIAKYSPDVVLGPATVYGKSLFGRLAAMNGGRMASDVTSVVAGDDGVQVTRPRYGGSVITTLKADGGPFFVTVRPKIYPESNDGAGEVVSESIDTADLAAGTTVRESRSESSGEVTLAEADVVVSAGRGVKAPENIELVQKLARAMNAAFGASSAVVDDGWTEYKYKVGQTGRTVNPKLYVAVGISGAIQHLVGMQTSQNIVAINKDKDAPIFSVSSYGIVGDLFEIVPALTKKFEAELKN